MAIAFVSSNGAQVFDGSSVTTVATDAFELTAGNFVVVVARVGTYTAGTDVDISDTAGNVYVKDGYGAKPTPSATYNEFVIWSCVDCLGDASNVVTLTCPSQDFVALNVMQFSGVPTSFTLDAITSANATSGGTVGVVPEAGSNLPTQIAIIASDLGNSGLPSFEVAPTADLTLAYSSGPDGNGPFIGDGSHSVMYNINTDQTWDNARTVYANYINTTDPITIMAAVYDVSTYVPPVTSTNPTGDFISGSGWQLHRFDLRIRPEERS